MSDEHLYALTSSSSSSVSSATSSGSGSSVSSATTDEIVSSLVSETTLRAVGPPPDDGFGPPVATNPLAKIPAADDFLEARVDALFPIAEHAVVHRYSPGQSRWEQRPMTVSVCVEPFACGAMRYGHYCVSLEHPETLLVAKRYRNAHHNTRDQVFADANMHHVAGHWARMFNNYNPPKKVRFVPACVLELTSRRPTVYLCLEPFMRGEYKKHNNNDGYVAKRSKEAAEALRCTPQAFLHFTYQFSGGNLMVCDIQGVGDVYTDPQILTKNGEGHGRGNIGSKGMRKCLRNHQCNAVCRRLGLQLIRAPVSAPASPTVAKASQPALRQPDTPVQPGGPQTPATPAPQPPPGVESTPFLKRLRSLFGSPNKSSSLSSAGAPASPATPVVAPATAKAVPMEATPAAAAAGGGRGELVAERFWSDDSDDGASISSDDNDADVPALRAAMREFNEVASPQVRVPPRARGEMQGEAQRSLAAMLDFQVDLQRRDSGAAAAADSD